MKKNYLNTLFVLLLLLSFSIFSDTSSAYNEAYCLADELANLSQTQVKERVLRLHVIANSDAQSDQLMKLKIKNAITEKYSSLLLSCESAEESAETFRENKSEVKEYVNSLLYKNGFSYECEIVIGIDSFPDKEYDGLFFPAGNYQAVKVILGKGEGKNWWCVLYPPLCFLSAASDEESVQYAEENNGKLQIRWKLKELYEKYTEKKERQ